MLFALVVAALESRDEHCDARADAGLEVAALETRDELCEAGLLPYAALPQLEIGGVGITAHSASARASRTSFQGRAVKGRLSIDSPTGHTTVGIHDQHSGTVRQEKNASQKNESVNTHASPHRPCKRIALLSSSQLKNKQT